MPALFHEVHGCSDVRYWSIIRTTRWSFLSIYSGALEFINTINSRIRRSIASLTADSLLRDTGEWERLGWSDVKTVMSSPPAAIWTLDPTLIIADTPCVDLDGRIE